MNRFLKRLDEVEKAARAMGPCQHARPEYKGNDIDEALKNFFAACEVCGWSPTWADLAMIADEYQTATRPA